MTGADKQQIKTVILRWHAQQLEEDSVRWKALLLQTTKSAEHERKMALRVYATVQRIDDQIKSRLPESFVVQRESPDDTRLERVAKMEMNVDALVENLNRYHEDHTDCLDVLNRIDEEKSTTITSNNNNNMYKLADIVRERVDRILTNLRRANAAKNRLHAENEVLQETLNLKNIQRRDSRDRSLQKEPVPERTMTSSNRRQASDDLADKKYIRDSVTIKQIESLPGEMTRERQIERVKPIVSRKHLPIVNDEFEIIDTPQPQMSVNKRTIECDMMSLNTDYNSWFQHQQQQQKQQNSNEYDKYSSSPRNHAPPNRYPDNDRRYNESVPSQSNNPKKSFRLPAIVKTDTTKSHESASRSVDFLRGEIMKFGNRLHQAQYEMDSCQKELTRMQAVAFANDPKILDRRHETIYRFRNPATVSMIRFPQLNLSEITDGMEGEKETGRSIRSEFHSDKRRKLRKS